jgi:hypothetical protein
VWRGFHAERPSRGGRISRRAAKIAEREGRKNQKKTQKVEGWATVICAAWVIGFVQNLRSREAAKKAKKAARSPVPNSAPLRLCGRPVRVLRHREGKFSREAAEIAEGVVLSNAGFPTRSVRQRRFGF